MQYLFLHSDGVADILETPKPLTETDLENLLGGPVGHVCLEGDEGICVVLNGLQVLDDPPDLPVNRFFPQRPLRGDLVIATFKDEAFLGITTADIAKFRQRLGPRCVLNPLPKPVPGFH
jgi:hypothetical protein